MCRNIPLLDGAIIIIFVNYFLVNLFSLLTPFSPFLGRYDLSVQIFFAFRFLVNVMT